MNEKRNTAFQNIWNTAKSVKKRIQGYVKKQKSQAILTLQLKELEKNDRCPWWLSCKDPPVMQQ